MARIKGIIPAAITPFDKNLDVDHGALVTFYRHLLDTGCSAVLSQGTTGEANSLSFNERLAIYDTLGDAGMGSRTMAGIGCCNLPETVALAKKAYEIGAAGVLVMPPFFYRAVGDDGIYDYFCRLFDRIGGLLRDVYIYDFPQMSGIDVSLETIQRLRTAYPGIVVGLKNSSGDFDEMQQQHAELDDFDVFPGSELYLLDGLRKGFAGCISASFNVFASDAVKVFDNWRTDRGVELQAIASAKRLEIQKLPMIPAVKALLSGNSPEECDVRSTIRPPLMGLDEHEIATLKRNLAEIG